MNIATRKTGRYPPVDVTFGAVWVSTDSGWWLKKINRIRAKTTIPRISVPTPMLLIVANSRTPKALMAVVLMSVTNDQKIALVSPGIGDCAVRSKLSRNDRTSGTVIATAVVVRTPAQK